MTNPDEKRNLSTTQLEEALAILNKEKGANVPTRRQKVVFVLFNISVFGVVATLVWILFVEAPPEWLYVVLGLLVMILPVLFLLNLPLLWKQWRQMRLIRKFGLQEALQAPWEQMKKSSRIANVATVAFACVGLLVMLFGLSEGLETDLLYGAIFFVLGLSFLTIYYVRRNRQKLEIVARLQETLTRRSVSSTKMGENIEIPREDYQLIATIERAQISRDRVRSIAEALDGPATVTYSVRKSDAFRDAVARLDQATRLAVENQIDDLTGHVPSATTGPRESARLPVPDTTLEISYAIDDTRQQIRIIGLEKATA